MAVALVASSLLSGCGAPQAPLTRYDQLSNTALFGRHPLIGVTIESGFEGQISGGFFLFAADVHGQIASTTNYIFNWNPTAGKSIWTNIPRSMIVVNIVEGQKQPEFEIIFKEDWLINPPNPFRESIDITQNEVRDYVYTEGSKLNLNNFIGPDSVDIVNVYISPEDLLPTK